MNEALINTALDQSIPAECDAINDGTPFTMIWFRSQGRMYRENAAGTDLELV